MVGERLVSQLLQQHLNVYTSCMVGERLVSQLLQQHLK